MSIIQNLWMLLILPLMAALFIFIPEEQMSYPKRRVTLFLTLFSSGLSLLLSIICAYHLIANPNDFFESNILFLNTGAFKIHIGVLLDNISAFMLFILYSISLPVCAFSYNYMKNEEGFNRYFIFLNLFIFSINFFLSSIKIFFLSSCVESPR